jgi:hypothetical protein
MQEREMQDAQYVEAGRNALRLVAVRYPHGLTQAASKGAERRYAALACADADAGASEVAKRQTAASLCAERPHAALASADADADAGASEGAAASAAASQCVERQYEALACALERLPEREFVRLWGKACTCVSNLPTALPAALHTARSQRAAAHTVLPQLIVGARGGWPPPSRRAVASLLLARGDIQLSAALALACQVRRSCLLRPAAAAALRAALTHLPVQMSDSDQHAVDAAFKEMLCMPSRVKRFGAEGLYLLKALLAQTAEV